MLATLLATLTVLSSAATIGSFAAEQDEANAVAAQVTEQQVAADEEVPPEITVGKVSNVKKSTSNPHNIVFSWSKAENASGYEIYRCSEDYDNGKFRKVGTVSTTSFNDTGLVQGSPYTYKIIAYTVDDGKTVKGDAVTFKTCTNPTKVNNIRRVRSSEVIQISWDKNAKATGYKILRASPSTKNQYVLYSTIYGATKNTFSDTKVYKGNIYYYKVVAFRQLSNGNMYHAPGATITCLSGLSAPGFSLSAQLYNVTVKWNRNPYATRYDVYYSTNKNATKYHKLGSSTGTSMTIRKMTGGKRLYFRVYPIYVKGNTLITGTANTKDIYNSGSIYGRTPGGTYIEIDKSQQRMWAYKNGKLVVSTPVVTGMRNSMDTPSGYHYINNKVRNTTLTGPGYASHVSYWMAFIGSGYGIHDASWRSSFGGSIYTWNGSHGCVNTPYNSVRTIYNNMPVGTPVIIYGH